MSIAGDVESPSLLPLLLLLLLLLLLVLLLLVLLQVLLLLLLLLQQLLLHAAATDTTASSSCCCGCKFSHNSWSNFRITARLFLTTSVFCLAIKVLVSPVYDTECEKGNKVFLRYKSISSNSVLSLRDNVLFQSGFLRWIALYVPDRFDVIHEGEGLCMWRDKIGNENQNLRLQPLQMRCTRD